ncbi:hypothetical protein K438DRAFT_1961208 [Mycena galopus ATCC 62051]|nr:hypothetical protein K438DRAFT_1961208 [Mycena galopus ATCC 62051]
MSNGVSGSTESQSGSEASDASQFFTVRFQHVTNEDGHHLIVGREAKLSRCEDEDLAFLLSSTSWRMNSLCARSQENAEELLGLSPRYLFSLECFTDMLPEAQEEASPIRRAGRPRGEQRPAFVDLLVRRPPPVGSNRLGQPWGNHRGVRARARHAQPAVPPRRRSESSGSVSTLNADTPSQDTLLPDTTPLPMPEAVLKDTADPLRTAAEEDAVKSGWAHGGGDPGEPLPINEQRGDTPDLGAFLHVVVCVIKDLWQFHRVLVYQFDEAWNGQEDLKTPLQLTTIRHATDKVWLLYDHSQSIVVRSQEDLKTPLNMTHCYLPAMSPIHLKFDNGVRGAVGARNVPLVWRAGDARLVSLLRLLSQSISRNIEHLSHAQRLTTRKLIDAMTPDNHPTGYIVSNANDLLGLFSADFGMLVVCDFVHSHSSNHSSLKSLRIRSRNHSLDSSTGEIDSLVETISSSHMVGPSPPGSLREHRRQSSSPSGLPTVLPGVFGVSDSSTPLRPVKVDGYSLDTPAMPPGGEDFKTSPFDNAINLTVLAKRLRLDGHDVVATTNGQEALDKVTSDRAYDAILMDIQMPILDGYAATQRIRALEKSSPPPDKPRLSNRLNGGHIPIFAVSASLKEHRRQEMANYGIDSWILKPIDFQRLKVILTGVMDPVQRELDIYRLVSIAVISGFDVLFGFWFVWYNIYNLQFGLVQRIG